MGAVNFLPMITGSFASPAAENPTVAIVEASYAATGIAARYVNCDVVPDALQAAVRGAVAQGWRGFNCSLPHKVEVVRHVDELTPAARLIGAVNCVTIENGRLIGDNTDGKGFTASLTQVRDPRGLSIVVLGAGGAGRAIAVELALAGATRVTIVNRRAERADEVARVVRAAGAPQVETVRWSGDFAVPGHCAVLVNATSVGLYPDVEAQPAVHMETLKPDLVVADVIPNPPMTRFLGAARARGCTTLDGRGMLVNQAAVAVEQWTGAPAAIEAMHAAYAQIFGSGE